MVSGSNSSLFTHFSHASCFTLHASCFPLHAIRSTLLWLFTHFRYASLPPSLPPHAVCYNNWWVVPVLYRTSVLDCWNNFCFSTGPGYWWRHANWGSLYKDQLGTLSLSRIQSFEVPALATPNEVDRVTKYLYRETSPCTTRTYDLFR